MRHIGMAALLCLLIFGSARGADWPQWLGPTRDGVTPEIIAPWTTTPQAVWRRPVGNGYSSPIVASGAVYLHAAVSGKDAEEVIALDAQTGEPLWTDVYTRGPYRSQLGVGPRTTPVVADERLYTYGITGVLTCYEAKSGKRVWQTNPYDEYKVSLPRFGVCSSPIVVGGRVVVIVGGGGSAVVAFDATTGELAWKGLDEPASSAAPVGFTHGVDEARQTDVVVQTTLRVVGLSPRDGTVRWEHPLVFQPSGVSPTPLVVGDALVCTTQDTGTMLLEFSKGDGKMGDNPQLRWWKDDLTSYFSTGATASAKQVYVVTNVQTPLPRADLRCLDATKGDELWRKDGLGYFHMAVVTLGDGKFLILDDAGNLLLAEGTDKGFQQLAKANVSRGTLSSPALSNGKIYVRDDREVICVDLSAKTLPPGDAK